MLRLAVQLIVWIVWGDQLSSQNQLIGLITKAVVGFVNLGDLRKDSWHSLLFVGAFRKLWFGVEVAYVTTSVWHSKLRLVHCVEPLTTVESLLDPPASPFASQGEMDQATPRKTWHVQLPTGGHVVDKVMLFKPEVLTTWSSHVITSICILLDCLRKKKIYIRMFPPL